MPQRYTHGGLAADSPQTTREPATGVPSGIGTTQAPESRGSSCLISLRARPCRRNREIVEEKRVDKNAKTAAKRSSAEALFDNRKH